MSKKGKIRTIIIIGVTVFVAAAVFLFVYLRKGKVNKGNGNVIYVESVKEIEGAGVGESTRFMGMVQSQETKTVNKDSSKKIKDVFVKVGDTVKEGDQLFSYDTTDMELSLEQLNLDLTGIQNSINSDNATLSDLTTQRNAATTEDERLSLNSQMNSTIAQINEEKYNLSLKQLEIKRQQDSINTAIVKSPMDGTIKKIASTSNDTSSTSSSDTTDVSASTSGTGDGFITIMQAGDFRIKGTADEQSISMLTTGTSVIVRSRLDSNKIWKGTVQQVKLEPESSSSNTNNTSMNGTSSAETTTKYTFYVNVDNTDGLMLGQHLYVEMDYGQTEATATDADADVIKIPSYYIMNENGKYYVWKRGADKRITKAEVEVGEYNSTNDTYPVKSGLTEDDYIAYPDPSIAEGDKTTTDPTKASTEESSSAGDAEINGTATDAYGTATDADSSINGTVTDADSDGKNTTSKDSESPER